MPSLDPFPRPSGARQRGALCSPPASPSPALWLRILHLLRPHHLQLEDKATQPRRVLAAPGHARKRGVQARTPRTVGGVLAQSSEASGTEECGSSRRP